MNEKDFFDYGGKILNSVNKAAEDGDFSNMENIDRKLFFIQFCKLKEAV